MLTLLGILALSFLVLLGVSNHEVPIKAADGLRLSRSERVFLVSVFPAFAATACAMGLFRVLSAAEVHQGLQEQWGAIRTGNRPA